MLSHPSASRLTAGLLIAGLFITPALAATGTVDTGDADHLRLRDQAGTSGRVLTTIAPGTQVEVLSQTDNGWYQVSYQDLTGYVSGDYLKVDEASPDAAQPEAPVPDDAAQAEPAAQAEAEGEEEKALYVKVTASSLNIRTGPSTDHEKAGALRTGRIVQVLEEADGWYRIDGGYISAEYTQPATEEEIAWLSASPVGQQAADYAMQFLGCSYVHGGNGPKSFDCSGLTKYVYAQFGCSLARTVEGQLKSGVSIPKDQLQPGDLVFFKGRNTGSTPASHVGIYIGGGQFVHASAPGVGVVTSDLYSKYYVSVYVDGRRVA